MFETLNPTRLAQQFQSSNTLVMVLRARDFVLVDINEPGLELTHLKREDVLGKRPGSIGAWADPSQREAIISALRQGRNLVNMPVAFRTRAADFADGILNTLLFDFAGAAYIFAFVQDMRAYSSRPESLARTFAETRSFFISAPIGMYRLLPGLMSFVEVNPALACMLGFASAAHMLEATRESGAQHYADEQEFERVKDSLLRDGQISARRVQLRRFDQSLFWAEETLRAVYGGINQKELLFIEGTLHDLTALETAQNAAQQSDLLYQTVVENATDGVFLVDRGIIKYCNRALALALGYSLPEIRGTDYQSLVAPEDLPAMMARREARSAGSVEPQYYEVRLLHKNGETRLFDVRAGAVELDGRIASSGTMRDITEARANQQRVQLADSRYRRLFEAASIGLFQIDLKTAFIEGNRSFARSLGYESFAELKAIVPQFQRLAANAQEITQMLSRVERGESVHEMELRLTHRQGNEIWVSMNVQRAHDAELGWRLECSAQDISRRRLAELQLKYQANHDLLTRLPNRARFEAQLGELIQRARGTGRYSAFGVILMDLDGFKLINDSLGHAAGDELLTMLSQRLIKVLPANMVLARYGGDEFALVSREPISESSVVQVAGNILAALDPPFLVHGHQVFSSASIGIVMMGPSYLDPQHVMRDADIAMYRSKTSGKSRYELYDSAMHQAARVRLALESDLRLALDRGEFVCYFQPVIELSSERIVGAEALVRWQHPVRGMQLPGSFLGVAEESGQLMALDWQMLETSCNQLLAWQREFGASAPLTVNVNVSDRLFVSRGFAGSLSDLIRRSGVKPECLQLEITETVFRENVVDTMEILRELKSIGLRLIVDDFGTGYSSLVSFAEAAFDGLKIDRGFIKDIESNARHRALVRTICQLAQDLNLSVVAEGVEREEQAELALALGCNYAQGFRYAPALTAEAFSMRLRAVSD